MASSRAQRLQVMLSTAELALIDDFRFQYRMPSRAVAVRELLQLGLAAGDLKQETVVVKSSHIGVFGRGEHSHDGKE